MDTVVANGTIVTGTDTYKADIGIADGRIVQIGASLATDGVKGNCSDLGGRVY